MKAGILFGGFGGVEIGMIGAGIEPLWSIEHDLEIAAVAQRNFGHKIIVANILAIDPSIVEPVDILHASPPCPNFSLAKANNAETEHDIALAQKTAQFIEILKPHVFTLENVWLYRKSESWKIIRDTLYACGYWLDVAHVNSADFGVPQTRKRMIVRAVRGGFVPYLPQPESWRGWYEAIEDLIPGLPDSQFAPWQLARLPKIITQSFLVMTANTNLLEADCQPGRGILSPGQPANTVVTYSNGQTPRAFLINSQNSNRELGRIVSMTTRTLARFQSFPDWYKLPENNRLACRGIGNAMPPVWYEMIILGLVGGAL